MRQKIIAVSVLLIVLYFPFFSHLSLQPLRLWDETRQAVNAYEMAENGNIIVTSYQGKPDMWNLKPPLLIWCQALLMKIFGPWELAVRLPSALSGFLTALMIFIFSWKYFNRFWLGFMAAIVLSTCRGYMDYHGVRTGDYDGMLTLFTVFYSLSFFLFFEKGKWKYFYWGMIGLTLAVMTKGIAGLFFLPAITIAAFVFGKVKIILTNRHFYQSFLFFITITGSYYLLHENYNPGYLQAVIENEWGGRFNSEIEGHGEHFWFYFEQTHLWLMVYWSLLIPCGFLTGILDNDKRFKKLIGYLAGIIVLFWLILSMSETRIIWYFYQVLPFLSILTATFLFYIFILLEKIEIAGILKYKILPYLFIFIVAYQPYHTIFKVVYLAPENDWDIPNYKMSYYLRDLAKGKFKLNEPVNIVYDGVAEHLLYYINIAVKNGSVARLKNKEQLEKGDLVLCSQDQIDNYLKENYLMDQINHSEHLYLYHITGRKGQ